MRSHFQAEIVNPIYDFVFQAFLTKGQIDRGATTDAVSFLRIGKTKILKNPVPESEPTPLGFWREALTNKRHISAHCSRPMSPLPWRSRRGSQIARLSSD